MATTVVRIRRQGGQVVQECDVYIGRRQTQGGWNLPQSKWANPYKVGQGGIKTVEEAVLAYWRWIHLPEQKHLRDAAPTELRSKRVGCFCRDQGHEPCHGDVLVYLADGVINEPLYKILEEAGEIPEGYNDTPPEPRAIYDRVRGGLMGLALGDALGVPHEFGAKIQYTGKLEHYHISRVGARFNKNNIKVFDLGQVSDDTEMTITLARSLIRNKGYDRKDVVTSYIRWARSGTPMMGRNTRDLFKIKETKKDPTGFKKYEENFKNKYGVYFEYPFKSATEASEAAQSNGSLMRCFPLSVLWSDDPTVYDVWCSNPSSVTLEVERLHVNCLRLALSGSSAKEVWEYAEKEGEESKFNEIKQVFEDVTTGADRVIHDEGKGENRTRVKGWVVHAFYVAMACLASLASDSPPSFGELMEWIIAGHPGSDTDTIASIAGGLIGSLIGFTELVKDQTTVDNIYTLLESGPNSDVPRDSEYRLDDFDEICKGLTELSGY